MKPVYWLALVGLVAVIVYGCEERKAGELRGRIAHLERETRRLDTVYVNQTKTKLIVRFKTDSILRTDTLFHVDTVRVLVRAERAACDAVIQTCEQRVAIRDSTIKALKSKSHTVSKVLWFLAGVGAGAVLK